LATSVSIRKDGRLTVRIEQGGDSLILRPLGELDIATADTLAAPWPKSSGGFRVATRRRWFSIWASLTSSTRWALRALLAAAKHSRETEAITRDRESHARPGIAPAFGRTRPRFGG
jgi:hypothetical protein